MQKHDTEVLWVQSRKHNVQFNHWRAWLIAGIVGATLTTPAAILAQRGSSNRGDRASRDGREKQDNPVGGMRDRNPSTNRDSSVNRNPFGNQGGRDRDS